MTPATSKHLDEIKNDFERGIFLAVYHSRKQRYHRAVAMAVLSLKHVLRGLLFSWPLYLLALAAWSIPDGPILMVLFLLLPAVYVSWTILSRGIREDYENHVRGYLLRSGYIGRLLFHGRH